jgi:hypothetical protein
MDTIRVVAKHPTTADTPDSIVSRIAAGGGIFVTERLAVELFAALKPDARIGSFYNGSQLVVEVDHGVLVEHFLSWRDAVLSCLRG